MFWLGLMLNKLLVKAIDLLQITHFTKLSMRLYPFLQKTLEGMSMERYFTLKKDFVKMILEGYRSRSIGKVEEMNKKKQRQQKQ